MRKGEILEPETIPAQAKWTLFRNGVQIDQKINNNYGFFSSPIFITFTKPAEAGNYTMTLDRITRPQTYPIITVTLAHPNPKPCALGSFDSANCLVVTAPPGSTAFEYQGSWYTSPVWCG